MTELDIRITELREKIAQFQAQGENADSGEWNELQQELEHLEEQKAVIEQLKS